MPTLTENGCVALPDDDHSIPGALVNPPSGQLRRLKAFEFWTRVPSGQDMKIPMLPERPSFTACAPTVNVTAVFVSW